MIAELGAALGPGEHQVEQLAGAREEAPVVAHLALGVDLQVLVEGVGAEGEDELGAPALVAARLEGGRAQQLDGLGEVVEARERVAQVGHVVDAVAVARRALGEALEPLPPLLLVGCALSEIDST